MGGGIRDSRGGKTRDDPFLSCVMGKLNLVDNKILSSAQTGCLTKKRSSMARANFR